MIRTRANLALLILVSCCAYGASVRADDGDKLRLPPATSARHEATTKTLPMDLLQEESIRKVGSALVIVFGCLVLWTALQRSTRKRTPGAGLMKPLGAVQLTPKVKLHVVLLGRRLLVLHLTGGRVERIAEITDPDEVSLFVGAQADKRLSASPRVEELLRATHAATDTAYPRGNLG